MKIADGNAQYIIRRLSLIVILVAVVVFLGHYGLQFLRAGDWTRMDSARPGRSGVPAGNWLDSDANDPLRPPASECKGGYSTRDGRLSLVYVSRATVPEVIQYYDRRMPTLGWKAVRTPPGQGIDDSILGYSNGNGNLCIIVVSEAEGGSHVTVVRNETK